MAIINYSIETVLDSASVLATLNPVLLDGQLGKETDTNKFKVGNGLLAWNNLDYHTTNNNLSVFMGPSSDPNNLVKTSLLDGGVALTKSELDFSNVVDLALDGTLTLIDRPQFVAEDRHKTAALLLGVFLKRVINAMGSDFSAVVSNPGYSGQTIQASLASLQNSINALSGNVSTFINDSGTASGTSWSSTKISSEITSAVQALRSQLVGNAGEALDTIYELGEALASNANFITTITDDLAKSVKITAQTFTNEQKSQARANIEAAKDSEVVKIAAQTLTDVQKAQVLANLGAVADLNLVKTVAQTLNEVQKAQARTNIGAIDGSGVQLKNEGIIIGTNSAVTSESFRLSNSIQILSHSTFGGGVNNGKGFLIGCGTGSNGTGTLTFWKFIGNTPGVTEGQPAFKIGGDDNFARVYDDKVMTEANAGTLSNKLYVRPREQRTSFPDGTNSIDLRTCGSFVSVRPSSTVTFVTDVLNTITDEGRSIALFLYPSAAVTFAANSAIKWAGGIIPTIPVNQITVIHLALIHFPGHIACWLATPGPSYP